MENLDIIIGTLIGSGLTTLVAFFVVRVFKSIQTGKSGFARCKSRTNNSIE